MADIEIRAARADDIVPIADRMRPADVRELWAASMAYPHEALARSFRRSDMVWTGTIDGRPEAMFGVGHMTVLGAGASAWLLGTPEIEKIPRYFLTESKVYVAMMLERHPRLMNFVDLRNRNTVSWLRRVGARFGDPRPYGPFARTFLPFVIERVEAPAHV